ncbi:hypothetical protein [Actinoplanes sp. NPDC051851]|uniref:hypothetical protein n=1 Tax=Actinoplanes sp. NPDC051851 TaxID=3154753 RepID=UPI003446545F
MPTLETGNVPGLTDEQKQTIDAQTAVWRNAFDRAPENNDAYIRWQISVRQQLWINGGEAGKAAVRNAERQEMQEGIAAAQRGDPYLARDNAAMAVSERMEAAANNTYHGTPDTRWGPNGTQVVNYAMESSRRDFAIRQQHQQMNPYDPPPFSYHNPAPGVQHMLQPPPGYGPPPQQQQYGRGGYYGGGHAAASALQSAYVPRPNEGRSMAPQPPQPNPYGQGQNYGPGPGQGGGGYGPGQ